MSTTQDLETHKEEALRDLKELLDPSADTCEAALRIVANKWWSTFQKRVGNYASFRAYAGTIYRHLLRYMASHIDPGDEGRVARKHFEKFAWVLVRNMPREFWHMFSLEWHDFHTAWIQTELAAEPDTQDMTKKQTESLAMLQRALKDKKVT